VDGFDLAIFATHFGHEGPCGVPLPLAAPMVIAGDVPQATMQVIVPDQAISTGEEFRVVVQISGAKDLYAVAFDLEYDEGKLEIVSVKEGKFLRGESGETIFQACIKNEVGKAIFGLARMDRSGVGGEGEVLLATFKVKEGRSEVSKIKISHEGLLSPDGVTRYRVKVVDGEVEIDGVESPLPGETALLQNYPNPFNPETWIPYKLSQQAHVVIKIYNISGQLVKTLDLGVKEPGIYATKEKAAYWDGKKEDGEWAASGVYFYQIRAGSYISTKKMVLLK
jgi:hypothetical protein